MQWDKWVAVLFPVFLQLLGALIPAVGGMLGGPIGWIVTFILSKVTAMLADVAERAIRFNKISAEVKAQVDAVNASAQEFFAIEDARERKGEPLTPEEKGKHDEAKKKLKDAYRELIKLHKPEPVASESE